MVFLLFHWKLLSQDLMGSHTVCGCLPSTASLSPVSPVSVPAHQCWSRSTWQQSYRRRFTASQMCGTWARQTCLSDSNGTFFLGLFLNELDLWALTKCISEKAKFIKQFLPWRTPLSDLLTLHVSYSCRLPCAQQGWKAPWVTADGGAHSHSCPGATPTIS